MTMNRIDQFAALMLECSLSIKALTDEIKRVENDGQLDAQDRLTQISDIRTRIADIGTDLDNARKEAILLGNTGNHYGSN
jgi:hypothetical protein